MKKTKVLAIAMFGYLLCIANLHAAESPEIRRAIDYGAKGKITLRVVDSKGNPVAGAKVSAGFYNPRNEADGMDGTTDANGQFTASGTPNGDMHYQITKDGYYKTESSYWFYRQNEPQIVKDGRWQPWNPTNTVVLKEKRKPIAMFARFADKVIPVQGKPIGFDLEYCDWVTPYGIGKISDLIFQYDGAYKGSQEYSKQIKINFSSENDGLESFELDKTSELMSQYNASDTGYVSNITFERERTPIKILKSEELDENHYLIFRVRSVTDSTGKIIGANYGKIYGPIEYGTMGKEQRLTFTYYFNPDGTRNLEFNPQLNLFTNLPWLEEKVSKP